MSGHQPLALTNSPSAEELALHRHLATATAELDAIMMRAAVVRADISATEEALHYIQRARQSTSQSDAPLEQLNVVASETSALNRLTTALQGIFSDAKSTEGRGSRPNDSSDDDDSGGSLTDDIDLVKNLR